MRATCATCLDKTIRYWLAIWAARSRAGPCDRAARAAAVCESATGSRSFPLDRRRAAHHGTAASRPRQRICRVVVFRAARGWPIGWRIGFGGLRGASPPVQGADRTRTLRGCNARRATRPSPGRMMTTTTTSPTDAAPDSRQPAAQQPLYPVEHRVGTQDHRQHVQIQAEADRCGMRSAEGVRVRPPFSARRRTAVLAPHCVGR
jgi:hypothetical protein